MLLGFIGPAYAKAPPLLFSEEDPQSMLSKQYKAYVVARTFFPDTLKNYQKQLVDSDVPLSKSVRLFVDTNIDWNTYARSIFGSRWQELSAEQQLNFRVLIREVLLRKYGKHFSPNAKFSIRFNKSTKYKLLKGNEFAKVPTTLISYKNNAAFDIDFVFFRGAKRWAVCDIHVDGVSHSQTYKTQVKRIFRKKGYPGVMKAFRRILKKS